MRKFGIDATILESLDGSHKGCRYKNVPVAHAAAALVAAIQHLNQFYRFEYQSAAQGFPAWGTITSEK